MLNCFINRHLYGQKVTEMLLFGHFYCPERRDGKSTVTDIQAIQIRELRKKGVGYKAIGGIVGLSRDIVRNFCKAHGLDGYASVINKNILEDIEQGKACLLCGKPIVQKFGVRPRKYCSDKCRRDWWKAHPEQIKKKETSLYTLICKKCGEEFISYGNKKRKYCSHNCYIKDRFWEDEDNGV